MKNIADENRTRPGRKEKYYKFARKRSWGEIIFIDTTVVFSTFVLFLISFGVPIVFIYFTYLRS
jgi:hypothetical protein